MIVTVLSLVMERSGSMHWLYLAYFGVAIFRVVYGQGPISFDRIADTRVVERIAGANAVGFYCVLGIIGMLALMQEVKSLWLRGGLAAGGVIEAVRQVMAGEIDNAFCAIRPPGHHAEVNQAMGFCYFNNIAIAARYLQDEWKLARIGIIDFDVHHVNGTQHIFEQDPTVL
ncbi:MAG: hypothetical protein EOM10_03930, partial [Opitutae bacterium]|nr:hypothetical protein [Opitutae bacterium]